MAAPGNITTANLGGKYTMNKTLTETAKTDEILRLQGVGWLTRKALSVGTLTLAVRQYADDAGVEHIDIDQTLTGGIPGSREERTLDWEARERADPVFGHVVGRTRRARVDEPEEPFLKKDWLPDTAEHKLVESYVESDTPKSKTMWTAHQAWGFQEVNGERRYTRLVKFSGPKGEDIEARIVYDYLGPL